MEYSFDQIEREFNETFGYVRQDIKAIRDANLSLNYTVALLICCACEMLSYHRGLQPEQVFAELLPEDGHHRAIAKRVFDALRNGLAHSFRPHNIRISREEWRFTLVWESGPHVAATFGKPNWLRLNMKILAERIAHQIGAYEQELRTNPEARSNFVRKSRKCVMEVPPSAKSEAAAWAWVLRNG